MVVLNRIKCLILTSTICLASCTPGSSETINSEEEPIVIELWQIDGGEKEKIYMEAINRFEEKNHGVKVRALRIPNDDYKQRMIVAMSGGAPPDVFTSWGGGWLKQFVDADRVMDLTEQDIPFDQFFDVSLGTATFNDEVYGLPLGLTLGLFFYNKQMFKEFGLDVPETYDDFLHVVEVIKENDVYPISLSNQTRWPGAYFLMYYADRLAEEGLFEEAYLRTGRGFDDEVYINSGEYIQELVELGAFNPGFNGMSYDSGQGRALLYNEHAAMSLTNSSLISNIRNEVPEFEEKVGIFTFPIIEGGQGDPTNIVGIANPVWSISSESEHPELAVELIKELSSLETAEAYINRTGSMSSVEAAQIEDPFVQQFADIANNATAIQASYDQSLQAELAELHKITTQEIFAGIKTPEEAARAMEKKAQELESNEN